MRTININIHRGEGVISKLIMALTRGNYSHASINFDHDRYESVMLGGVVKNREQIINKSKIVEIYSIKVTNKNYEILEKWVAEQVGKKYDYSAILSFIFPIFNNPRMGYWYCSEIAYVLYSKCKGILGDVDNQKISPQLLRDILRLDKDIKLVSSK